MSIEQRKVVDVVAVKPEDGAVYLFIIDPLDWDDPKNDHLFLLQEKINDYLLYIESGELLQAFPDAEDMRPIIQVVCKYELNDIAAQFYARASELIAAAGYELSYKISDAELPEEEV